MTAQSKLIVALFSGIAAGAALGILFAPGKGTENRDALTGSLIKLRDTIISNVAVQIDLLKSKFTGEQEEVPDDLEHA